MRKGCSSPRLEGTRFARSVLSFLELRPRRAKGMTKDHHRRRCLLVKLLTSATSCRAVSFTRTYIHIWLMCVCAPCLPWDRFSHHFASPWLLEVAASNYPPESSFSNYSRPPLPPPPLRHCYGFFVVTLLLRTARAVSWLTCYTRIHIPR